MWSPYFFGAKRAAAHLRVSTRKRATLQFSCVAVSALPHLPNHATRPRRRGDRVNRRAFITLLGGAAAWPLAARQPATPLVGFLHSGAQDSNVTVNNRREGRSLPKFNPAVRRGRSNGRNSRTQSGVPSQNLCAAVFRAAARGRNAHGLDRRAGKRKRRRAGRWPAPAGASY
jgi:hypothetical protein